MKLQTVKNISELLAYQQEWIELSRTSAKSIFQTPGWVLPWWQIFGADYRLHCVAAFEGNTLVGLAPLMIKHEGETRVLQFIGTPLNDYNAFLCRQDRAAEIGQAMFAYLCEGSPRYDCFAVESIETFERALGVVPDLTSGVVRMRDERYEPAPLMPLPNTWADYEATLTKDRRNSYRYLRRRLWRDVAPEFTVLTQPAEILAHIEQFEDKRIKSWIYRERLAEILDLIKTKEFFAFLKLFAAQLPATGGLQFGVVRKGDEVLASGLYFCAAGRMMKYMQSWDHTYAQFSPGTVLDLLMVEHAIAQGYSVFDFGRGNEEYKYRMGAREHHIQSAVFDFGQPAVLLPTLKSRVAV